MPRPTELDIPDNADNFLSTTQKRLVQAFEDGTIVGWELDRSGGGSGGVWDGDVVLPQELAIIGDAGADALFAHDQRTVDEILPTIAIPNPHSEHRDVIAIYSNTAFVDMVKNLVCNFNTLGIVRYIVFALDDRLCELLRVIDAPCFFDQRWEVKKYKIEKKIY